MRKSFKILIGLFFLGLFLLALVNFAGLVIGPGFDP